MNNLKQKSAIQLLNEELVDVKPAPKRLVAKGTILALYGVIKVLEIPRNIEMKRTINRQEDEKRLFASCGIEFPSAYDPAILSMAVDDMRATGTTDIYPKKEIIGGNQKTR